MKADGVGGEEVGQQKQTDDIAAGKGEGAGDREAEDGKGNPNEKAVEVLFLHVEGTHVELNEGAREDEGDGQGQENDGKAKGSQGFEERAASETARLFPGLHRRERRGDWRGC